VFAARLVSNAARWSLIGDRLWIASLEGRQLLNRIAVFYSIPYFDVGVRLVADGAGGVSHICGSVHYLQPDGSSLVSRGVVTEPGLRAEVLMPPGRFTVYQILFSSNRPDRSPGNHALCSAINSTAAFLPAAMNRGLARKATSGCHQWRAGSATRKLSDYAHRGGHEIIAGTRVRSPCDEIDCPSSVLNVRSIAVFLRPLERQRDSLNQPQARRNPSITNVCFPNSCKSHGRWYDPGQGGGTMTLWLKEAVSSDFFQNQMTAICQACHEATGA
jgi:hypothetical protein